MTADHIQHRLAFALRVDEHFTREPLAEAIDVRLSSGEPAVPSPGGGARHGDGTYRWVNLTDGLRAVTLRAPSGRWVRWEPAPVQVVVPIADPRTALRVEVWPTPLAAVPPGVTAIRGKLVGAAAGGLRVEIDGTGAAPAGRWTRADPDGEFLYLLPGGPWPAAAAGALALTAAVAGRTVARVDIDGGGTFAGPQFEIPSQRTARARIHVI